MSPPTRRSRPGGNGPAGTSSDDYRDADQSIRPRPQPGVAPQELTLDDELEQGRALRDEGAKQALDAAHLVARGAAEAVLQELADSGGPFTADDVHRRVGGPLGCSSGVMGALFRTAARAGTIECIGYRPSTRAARHAGIVRVWRGAA